MLGTLAGIVIGNKIAGGAKSVVGNAKKIKNNINKYYASKKPKVTNKINNKQKGITSPDYVQKLGRVMGLNK